MKKLESKLGNSLLLACIGICLTVALAVPVNVTFNSYRELEKQTQILKDQTQTLRTQDETLKEQNIVIREQDKELSLLKERLAAVETKITR